MGIVRLEVRFVRAVLYISCEKGELGMEIVAAHYAARSHVMSDRSLSGNVLLPCGSIK